MRLKSFFGMAVAAAALALGGCETKVEGGGSGGDAGSGGQTSSSSATASSGSATTGSGGAGGGVVLMPGECRTEADCMSGGELCLSPDAPPLCGICYIPQNPCTTDAQCAAVDPQTICEKPSCSCGESECMPGCMSDMECPTWQHCSPGHRCTPDACATDADCGPNIGCDPATKACARKTCATDAQCEDICVNGSCYEKAGTCMFPPP